MSLFSGQFAHVLAPLTKGGNVAFRRLCAQLGAPCTVSEMALARKLVRGDRVELALLRRSPEERLFGVQIAASSPQEAADAAVLAAEHGADFVDLNCGCPKEEATSKHQGAALLRRPGKLLRILRAMVNASPVPVTVKLRVGWSSADELAGRILPAVADSGVSAVFLHGRTRYAPSQHAL